MIAEDPRKSINPSQTKMRKMSPQDSPRPETGAMLASNGPDREEERLSIQLVQQKLKKKADEFFRSNTKNSQKNESNYSSELLFNVDLQNRGQNSLEIDHESQKIQKNVFDQNSKKSGFLASKRDSLGFTGFDSSTSLVISQSNLGSQAKNRKSSLSKNSQFYHQEPKLELVYDDEGDLEVAEEWSDQLVLTPADRNRMESRNRFLEVLDHCIMHLEANQASEGFGAARGGGYEGDEPSRVLDYQDTPIPSQNRVQNQYNDPQRHQGYSQNQQTTPSERIDPQNYLQIPPNGLPASYPQNGFDDSYPEIDPQNSSLHQNNPKQHQSDRVSLPMDSHPHSNPKKGRNHGYSSSKIIRKNFSKSIKEHHRAPQKMDSNTQHHSPLLPREVIPPDQTIIFENFRNESSFDSVSPMGINGRERQQGRTESMFKTPNHGPEARNGGNVILSEPDQIGQFLSGSGSGARQTDRAGINDYQIDVMRSRESSNQTGNAENRFFLKKQKIQLLDFYRDSASNVDASGEVEYPEEMNGRVFVTRKTEDEPKNQKTTKRPKRQSDGPQGAMEDSGKPTEARNHRRNRRNHLENYYSIKNLKNKNWPKNHNISGQVAAQLPETPLQELSYPGRGLVEARLRLTSENFRSGSPSSESLQGPLKGQNHGELAGKRHRHPPNGHIHQGNELYEQENHFLRKIRERGLELINDFPHRHQLHKRHHNTSPHCRKKRQQSSRDLLAKMTKKENFKKQSKNQKTKPPGRFSSTPSRSEHLQTDPDDLESSSAAFYQYFYKDEKSGILIQENRQLRYLMSDYLKEIDQIRYAYAQLRKKYSKVKQENVKLKKKFESFSRYFSSNNLARRRASCAEEPMGSSARPFGHIAAEKKKHRSQETVKGKERSFSVDRFFIDFDGVQEERRTLKMHERARRGQGMGISRQIDPGKTSKFSWATAILKHNRTKSKGGKASGGLAKARFMSRSKARLHQNRVSEGEKNQKTTRAYLTKSFKERLQEMRGEKKFNGSYHLKLRGKNLAKNSGNHQISKIAKFGGDKGLGMVDSGGNRFNSVADLYQMNLSHQEEEFVKNLTFLNNRENRAKKKSRRMIGEDGAEFLNDIVQAGEAQGGRKAYLKKGANFGQIGERLKNRLGSTERDKIWANIMGLKSFEEKIGSQLSIRRTSRPGLGGFMEPQKLARKQRRNDRLSGEYYKTSMFQINNFIG